MDEINHCILDRPQRYRGNGAGPPPSAPPRVRFQTLSKLRANLKGAQYLVKPIVEKDTLSVLFGDSDTYKSFLMFDLGLSIAHGVPFAGLPTKQGAVFVVCGEGQGGIARRVEAWHIGRGIHRDAPFYVSEIPAALFEPDNATALGDEIAEMAEEQGVTPVLVIIDTLSTNMGDGDESKNPDIARFLANVNVHVRARFQSAVIVVHHVGHGDKERERGAYALRGNSDCRVLVKRMVGEITTSLHCLKTKDSPRWEPIGFQGRVIEFPELYDSEGEPQTSLYFERAHYAPPPEKQSLGSKQWKALSALEELYIEHQQRIAKSGFASTPRVRTIDWRDRCVERGICSDRRRFSEAKLALVKKQLVHEEGEFSYVDPDSA